MLMEIFNLLSANNTDEKILDFADVTPGWHFGEGATISAAAIRDATKLHEAFLLNGFYETDAFPGLAGEIRVTAYHENQYFEFTREMNGGWSYICEIDGAVEEELENLSLEQVQGIIKTASNNLWNIYDISLGNIGIQGSEDFKVSPLDHQTTEEFRSWNSLAPQPGIHYVSTSGYFIPPQASRQFFGGSQTPYYQTPHQSLNRRVIQATHAIGTSSISPTKIPRIYSKSSVLNPMISKSAWETSQDASALQTCLRFEAD